MKYRIRKNRSGSVLAFVIVIGVILAALGTGILAVGYNARIQTVRAADRISARIAADAGMAKAMYILNKGFKDGTLDEESLPAESGVLMPDFAGLFTYTVTGDSASGYTIVSNGNYNGTSMTTETVAKVEGSSADFALFALTELILHNSAKVDWYNNDSDDSPLTIGTNSITNGAVDLKNSSEINGDIAIGVGGDPEPGKVVKVGNSAKYDDILVQTSNYVPSPVAIPSYLDSSPSGGQIKKNTTIKTSGKYSKIDLGNSEKLVIDGDVELYVTGDIVLGNSAEIEITDGSSLTIYIDGDVEGKNSSKFNNKSKDPKNFKIMGTETSSKIELKNSGDMYGIVYAPDADIIMHNSATFWGMMTGDNIDLRNSATFYFDASLRDEIDESNLSLAVSRWREY